MDFDEAKAQLIEWIGDLRFFADGPDKYLYQEINSLRNEKTAYIRLYTFRNAYHIVLASRGGEIPYLGCQASSRTPRAGCVYGGGRDLSDGDFSHDLWVEILGDIVGFELVKIDRSAHEFYGERAKQIWRLEKGGPFQKDSEEEEEVQEPLVKQEREAPVQEDSWIEVGGERVVYKHKLTGPFLEKDLVNAFRVVEDDKGRVVQVRIYPAHKGSFMHIRGLSGHFKTGTLKGSPSYFGDIWNAQVYLDESIPKDEIWAWKAQDK